MKKKEFLKYFPGYYLKTLDDKASKGAIPKRLRIFSIEREGTPEQLTDEELTKLNKQGAGIFFTPCDFTGATNRKASSCKKINAWFMECDWGKKEEQMLMIKNYSPLQPSFIVETGKSYHCYWLAKDGTKEKFRDIQSRLIHAYDGDPANKDMARVFRIPEYYHMKKEPFMVKLVSIHPELKYTEQEMLDAYKSPNLKPEKPKKMQTASSFTDELWATMVATSNREMLEKLSGNALVNGEHFSFHKRGGDGSEFIYVNDEPCDAWLDSQGMIGSGKGGGPTWIQWVMYYGKTKREIAAWFKENCRHLIQEEGVESMDEILKQIDASWDNPVMSWGVHEMDINAAPIIKGSYVLLFGEMSSGKTPFTLQMAIKNAELGFSVAYFSLEVPNKTLLRNWALNKLGATFKQAKENEIIKFKVRKMIEGIAKKITFVKFSKNNIDYIIERSVAGGYDLVIVDNIGYVAADATYDEHQGEKVISRGLNSLSRDHGITVVAIQHFRKRSGSGRKKNEEEDYEANLFRGYDSIAGTAKFNQDPWILAQVARIMNPNATYEEKQKFYVLIMKDKEHDKRGLSTMRYIDGEFIT